MEKSLQKLAEKRKKAALGGGESRIKAQHDRGKLTARERIDLLCDPGTFVELDAFMTHDCNNFGMEDKKFVGDGVVTGYGKIEGRTVCLYSQDFTVFGGSLSATISKKICKVMEMAVRNGVPVIGINDSGGARIQEGVASLGGYADIFYRNVQASGVVPQLSLIMGPCAGGAVYSPAITDFIFMVDQTSHMFITGPDVIKTVTGEEVTFEELGGAFAHTSKSGVADLKLSSEMEAIEAAKLWLSYLPSNNLDAPPSTDFVADEDQIRQATKDLAAIVPENPNQPYNIMDVIEKVVDPESFMPLNPDFAPNLTIGFARLNGQSVGIVGNNPAHLAGVLDIDGSVKGARFIRFCDSFNIPILTFIDVPGFLPGTDQESGGIIRHGAKLLYAYCEATVPKLSVVTRKSYGGAYCVMNSKHIGADLYVAWPNAEIAVMGASGACNVIFRKDIANADDPETKRQELTDLYAEKFSNPYQAAERGYIDAVIYPEETREYLISGLEMARSKKVKGPARKHGNIPL